MTHWTKEKKGKKKRSYAKERASNTLLRLLVAVFFFVLGVCSVLYQEHLERQWVTKEANEGTMERENKSKRESKLLGTL